LDSERSPASTFKSNAASVVKHETFTLAIILAALIAVFEVTTRGLSLDRTNVANILLQSSMLGVAAIGQAFVILRSGIDLSIGGIALMSVVMGESMEDVNTSFGRAGPDFDLRTSARNIDVDDSLVTIDNVVEVRAKWASYGKDYYNWPLCQDEKFIQYPSP